MSSKSSLGFKRICVWVSTSVAGILILAVSCLLYILIPGFIDVVQHPHRPAYAADSQLSQSKVDLTKVVRPLIGPESRFDLLASVYINSTGTPVPEECIFSEVVLRDLDVTSQASAEVDLRIPLAPYKGLKINMDDFMKGGVRASFTLIPRGMDKIRARKFKSYLDGLGFNRPTRPGFPHPDLWGQSIDRNAASDTLVLYVQKERQCEIDFEDPEEEAGHFTLAKELARKVASHPRIKTRSWVVMVRDENLYKLRDFDKHLDQNHEMMVRCRDGFAGVPQANCDRSFETVGNFRHKLAIEAPGPSGKKTHWLYSPYLFVPSTSAGPMDSVAVPVQVEDCEDLAPMDFDQDFMDLKWTIAFSSLTPAKATFIQGVSAMIESKAWVDDNLKQQSQDVVDMLNAIVGHAYDQDARPVRRFVFSALSLLLGTILVPLLSLHYWLTRQNITGLAIDSAAIIRTLSALFMIKELSISNLSLAFFASVPAIIQFWVVSLFSVRWGMKMLPTGVEKRPASTTEERSIQHYKAIPLQTKLGIWCISLAVCVLDTYTNVHFFAVGGPPPVPVRPDNFVGQVLLILALTSSLWIKSLQLYFNHVSGTFAGDHRITAVLGALAASLDLLMCSSTWVGNWSAYRSLTVQKLTVTALAFGNLWQCLTLPIVDQSKTAAREPVKEE